MAHIETKEMNDHNLPAVISVSEIALPADLVEAARDFARASHAVRTQESYGRWWADFTAWCGDKGLASLPAAPEAVAVWMSALAVGEGGRKPLARASINQALSAVIFYHRDAGHSFDRKHRIIARTWAGISRTKAQTDIVRKAKPLLATDLRDIVERLKPNKPIDGRNGALLTLGWAGALRRSELVGLDWLMPGDGTGFVTIDDRGIVIVLKTSKASRMSPKPSSSPRPTCLRHAGRWRPGRPLPDWSPVSPCSGRSISMATSAQTGLPMTASRPLCRGVCASWSTDVAKPGRTPRQLRRRSRDTRCARVTPPARPQRTCRASEFSSTPGTRRWIWWLATFARPIGGVSRD
jgi:integrase